MTYNLKRSNRQSGFTLVEIAIVLVIIGLLLGGILKGQEMITQARIKNVINDFNGITAAYFGYQDRYRAVPGDDGGAFARWSVTYGAWGGNSDGSVAGEYFGPAVAPLNAGGGGALIAPITGESMIFWQHLRAAGFVAGPASGVGSNTPPSNAVGGIVGVQNGAFGGAVAPVTPLSGHVMCSSSVPDKIAGAVDSQLDDRRSNGGSIRAATLAGNASVLAAAPAATYVEDGNSTYVVCRSI